MKSSGTFSRISWGRVRSVHIESRAMSSSSISQLQAADASSESSGESNVSRTDDDVPLRTLPNTCLVMPREDE